MLTLAHLVKGISFDTKPADNIKKVVITKLTLMSYDTALEGTATARINSNETIFDAVEKKFGKNILYEGDIIYRMKIVFCLEPKSNERFGRKIKSHFNLPK